MCVNVGNINNQCEVNKYEPIILYNVHENTHWNNQNYRFHKFEWNYGSYDCSVAKNIKRIIWNGNYYVNNMNPKFSLSFLKVSKIKVKININTINIKRNLNLKDHVFFHNGRINSVWKDLKGNWVNIEQTLFGRNGILNDTTQDTINLECSFSSYFCRNSWVVNKQNGIKNVLRIDLNTKKVIKNVVLNVVRFLNLNVRIEKVNGNCNTENHPKKVRIKWNQRCNVGNEVVNLKNFVNIQLNTFLNLIFLISGITNVHVIINGNDDIVKKY